MTKKQYYKYVITLDRPMWPRKIADELSFARELDARLISVTDLQNDGHMYGNTYVVPERSTRPKLRSMWRTLPAAMH